MTFSLCVLMAIDGLVSGLDKVDRINAFLLVV